MKDLLDIILHVPGMVYRLLLENKLEIKYTQFLHPQNVLAPLNSPTRTTEFFPLKKPEIVEKHIKNELHPIVQEFLESHENSYLASLIEKKNQQIIELYKNPIFEKFSEINVYTIVDKNNRILMFSPPEIKIPNAPYQVEDPSLSTLCRDGIPLTPTSLFFLNREDAYDHIMHMWENEKTENIEEIEDLNESDPQEKFERMKEAETISEKKDKLDLKILELNLNVFYQLKKASPDLFASHKDIEYKLIGNLTELNTVINKKNIKSSHYTIHTNQNYSTNWFQGIPIYIFKMYDPNGSYLNKQFVFFSSHQAQLWSKTLIWQPRWNISPFRIEIYNLENFILDLQNISAKELDNIYVFPPQQTLKKTKILGEIIDPKNRKPLHMEKKKPITKDGFFKIFAEIVRNHEYNFQYNVTDVI
jgi:hypothetical protein